MYVTSCVSFYTVFAALVVFSDSPYRQTEDEHFPERKMIERQIVGGSSTLLASFILCCARGLGILLPMEFVLDDKTTWTKDCWTQVWSTLKIPVSCLKSMWDVRSRLNWNRRPIHFHLFLRHWSSLWVRSRVPWVGCISWYTRQSNSVSGICCVQQSHFIPHQEKIMHRCKG